MGGFRGRVTRGDQTGPARVSVSDESLAITSRKKRGTLVESVAAKIAAATSTDGPISAPEPEPVPVEAKATDAPAPAEQVRVPDPVDVAEQVQLDIEVADEPLEQESASLPSSDEPPTVEAERKPPVEDPTVVLPPEPVRAVPDIDDDLRHRLTDLVASFDWSRPEQRDPNPVVSIVKNPTGIVFDLPVDPVTEAAIHGHVLMSVCQSPYGSRPVTLEERWDVFCAMTRRVRPVVRIIAQAHYACALPPSGWIPVATDVGRAINHHLRLDRYVPGVAGTEIDWNMSDPIEAAFALTARAVAARKRSAMRDVLDGVAGLAVPEDHRGSVIVDAIKRRKDGTDLARVNTADLSAAEDLWQANRIALQGVGAADMAERLAAFLVATASSKDDDEAAA